MKASWTACVALAWVLAANLAGGARPALAQGGALPPDVSAAIEAAIRAGEEAAARAELSAAIAKQSAPSEAGERARTQVEGTAFADAVVGGIARHPDAVSAIVRAAADRAPTHRQAIVHRASVAFPAFAREIAAAAGGPPVQPYAPQARPYAPPVQPYAPPVQPYAPPPTVAMPPTAAAAPQPRQAARRAASDGEFVDGIYALNGDYWIGYGTNAWRLVTSPLRYDRDDWIRVAVIAGITGTLILADDALMDFWQDTVRSGGTDDLATAFEVFGQEEMIYGLASAYALAEVLGMKREKATALLALESFALSGALVAGMKWITGRERPDDADNAYDFKGPGGAGTNASFPSGHTVAAFGAASVIAEMYGDKWPVVPWIAYTAATGTALSRVNNEDHWFSDVFAAGAIGYFVGKMVTRLSPFMVRNDMTINPFAVSGGAGAVLSFKF
jgi:membrane-associated phospholipid phosphatase